jgi:hypothetical protein
MGRSEVPEAGLASSASIWAAGGRASTEGWSAGAHEGDAGRGQVPSRITGGGLKPGPAASSDILSALKSVRVIRDIWCFPFVDIDERRVRRNGDAVDDLGFVEPDFG